MAPCVRIRRTKARVSMPLDADDAVASQIFVELALGSKIACPAALLANNEAGQMRLVAFDVLGVHAVVANFRIGHRDDLPAITRIRQDFLIAGHRRIETDFAVDFTECAERFSGENSAVFQREFCELSHRREMVK